MEGENVKIRFIRVHKYKKKTFYFVFRKFVRYFAARNVPCSVLWKGVVKEAGRRECLYIIIGVNARRKRPVKTATEKQLTILTKNRYLFYY